MIDIEKLKQVALAATQGEWVFDKEDNHISSDGRNTIAQPISGATISTEQRDRNGDYIATANPSAILELITRLEAAESQLEAVTQQARIWKMDALTHKSTVQECYQACTGSTGEPGDWNGANPVKQLAMQIVEKDAEIDRLNERVFIEESNGKHWETCYSKWVQTDTDARALIHKDEQLAAQ